MDPAKFNLKQAFSALKEARKGNTISQAIYRKWADRNAMPHDNDPECGSIQTYQDFTKKHIEVWYFD
jgi:hypothetical protein